MYVSTSGNIQKIWVKKKALSESIQANLLNASLTRLMLVTQTKLNLGETVTVTLQSKRVIECKVHSIHSLFDENAYYIELMVQNESKQLRQNWLHCLTTELDFLFVSDSLSSSDMLRN